MFTEEQLEQTTLAWFENLGYNIEHGPDIAFDGSRLKHDTEENYADVILGSRLREALERINSDVPLKAIEIVCSSYLPIYEPQNSL